MARFRWFLAALVFCSFAAPMRLAADDKKSSDEALSRELELKACGPKEKEVDYDAATDKKQHPVPEQPADKALIYVLRPSMIGNAVQSKLAVDGDWKELIGGTTISILLSIRANILSAPRPKIAVY